LVIGWRLSISDCPSQITNKSKITNQKSPTNDQSPIAKSAMVTLTVNGRSHRVDVDPTTPLLYVLADDLELKGRSSGAASDSAGRVPCSSGGGRFARAAHRSAW
jgi:hypothetical protein